MDEIKSMFYEDVKEKSITAHGSHGVGKKYDNNPRYTRREIKKKSGGTYTMNLNKWMSYKKFKSLPENMQKEYIIHIVEEYDVGRATFAKMWGLVLSTTWQMFKRLGIPSPDYDAGKERLFLEKFRPEALMDNTEKKPGKKPKKKAVKKSTETSVKVEESTPVTEAKTRPLFEFDPTFCVDNCSVFTNTKFEDLDSMLRFFMRYVPIRSDVHIELKVTTLKNSKEVEVTNLAFEGASEN